MVTKQQGRDEAVIIGDLKTTFIRATDYPFQKLEGETIILVPRSRRVHLLNETGSFIWDLLDRERNIIEIIEELCSNYEVEFDKAKDDVIKFMTALMNENLVVKKNKKVKKVD